ncbi:DNA-directed DNA polymerase epsilon, subunit B [Yamadazyma tenuis]|uniref:DNA polymerase epsilon subunit B n=1 Tax=Candida tenuis (strain ATCC 10573 / BCRC 21748 / CBS 615 / JCM 9827 / NBRC 10315 / NRRL Y-1498 / VKM Y-70) TaxID=590646 RepID=G3B1H1_CANTC|nr:uncharacterized protein CANTEDRAFT_103862 [Yamadazyma tenuis ATCC 10573]EGV64971.1 hypothetical protein CANTEDRAFT_103862 [Yamadazyma tenuis ATCC 10573]WEJ97764.1 DNA-directed DNA polymerase epsilon, subunit B [Yamadazyma tenuis]
METRVHLPVKLQPSNLRPTAYRIFSKKHGLNIQTDALKVLTDVVSHKFGSEWKGAKAQLYLEDIAKIWKAQDKGLFVDGEGLNEVLKQLNNEEKTKINRVIDEENKENINEEEELQWQEFFRVINPPEQPNYTFDKQRKQFGLRGEGKLSNFRDTNIEYFNNRYSLIRDRLSRNEVFQKTNYQSISNIKSKKQSKEITLIKNIIGNNGQSFIIFGLLTKNFRGVYTIEDTTDSIELNLDQAQKMLDAFYTEGMFLTAEGLYSQFNENSPNGIFHVTHLGHPPAERRDISSEHYGNLDFLNINKENLSNLHHSSKVSKDFRKKLVRLEKQLTDHKFIILGSNIYLDDLKIMKGLRKLFSRLEKDLTEEEEEAPVSLVLTGSFVSKPISSIQSSTSSISNSESYKNNFNNLANLIAEFPTIKSKVMLVLIPGPNDPWQSTHSLGSSNLNYLPQPSIPSIFLNRLERLLPKGHLKLGWNPVRVNYLSQEIVILKDDLMSKFKRNDIILESDLNQSNELLSENVDDNIPTKLKQARCLVRTLLDQGHLQPLSKGLKLVNPIYAHSLRIEPLPSLVILNDTKFENFEVPYTGCRVVNISSFLSDNRFNYLEYYPSQKAFKFKDLYL